VIFRAAGGKADVLRVVGRLKRKFGDEPSIRLVEYDGESGVLRCGHLQLQRVKAELQAAREAGISVIGVSGTVRAAKRKFMPPSAGAFPGQGINRRRSYE
jgi:RNase P/RNase MRP subunit POP5